MKSFFTAISILIFVLDLSAQIEENVTFIVQIEDALIGCSSPMETVRLIDSTKQDTGQPLLKCGYFSISESEYLRSHQIIIETDNLEFRLPIFHIENPTSPITYVVIKYGKKYECNIYNNYNHSGGMLSGYAEVKKK